ncbi:MAG: class I SAM-dependent RNA methyltransferase [Syntrophaceae bacterium]|nr:class I SAM-dependent RNA methyltransferase [Syntrophaceae bacterium]
MTRNGKTGNGIRMTIDAVAFGGDGVGRPDGLVTFVPYTVDGDEVVADVTERRNHYARAVLREVLSPSPRRVEPDCVYYGRCGGCSLQHVRYGHQLTIKERHVAESFARIGRFMDLPLQPVIPSPLVFSYRGRAEIHVQYGGGRKTKAGFMERGSHNVLDVDRCLLLADSVNESLPLLRRSLEERRNGPVRREERLLWSAPGHGSPNRGNPALPGRGHIHRVVKGVLLSVPDRGFFQANESLVDTLVDVVLELASPSLDEAVLDAYCGSGLFSRFLAPRAGSVFGIEQDRAAVACARENLLRDGFREAHFHAGDVAEGLRDVLSRRHRIDAAVLDPPRTGCSREVLEALVDLAPRRIVYVSCNPATQARDARFLADRGFVIAALQPLDMFPQTSHIETAALFEAV